jgi:hypothetical protein
MYECRSRGGTDIPLCEYISEEQIEGYALLELVVHGYDVEVQNRTPCHRDGSALTITVFLTNQDDGVGNMALFLFGNSALLFPCQLQSS